MLEKEDFSAFSSTVTPIRMDFGVAPQYLRGSA